MVKTWGEDTVRGGQTVVHGVRMWGQLARLCVMLIAALAVAVPAVLLWRAHSGYDAYAVAMLTLAEVKLAIGYAADSGQEVRLEDGRTVVTTIETLAGHGPWLALRAQVLQSIYTGAWLGAKLGAGSVLGLLVWFRWRGHRLKRLKRLRGAELVSARQLCGRIDPLPGRAARWLAGAPAPYRVAGVPYPWRAETQHTFVTGTTGSGKTVLIADLVAQIRRRGERCIVYDKMGSYTQAFFDPERDVLMNPLDARSPRWSPFLEAGSHNDFDTMAAALIPQQKDTVDPFWVTAARQLFAHGAWVLWQKGETKNRALVEHLLKTDLTELARAMEGTVAQSIVDAKNPKTALSVRAMLTANIGALDLLPDSGTPFSIREWMSRDRDGGFLFMTSRGDQHASLRGLISTWLEIAVTALLSLDQDTERRVWVVLDELPTLHQVPSLHPGLAESRQFGGCFVLGAQVASALRDLYGRDGAQTLCSLCGAHAVLAAPDGETAQWAAENLGRSEVETLAEGVSYGADSFRDGVTLTPRREVRPVVLPSQIMRLENLQGYLKLRGQYPVARIGLKYVKRPKIAPRFVARTPAAGRAAPGKSAAGRAAPGKSAAGRAAPGKSAAGRAAPGKPGHGQTTLALPAPETPSAKESPEASDAVQPQPLPPEQAAGDGPDNPLASGIEGPGEGEPQDESQRDANRGFAVTWT